MVCFTRFVCGMLVYVVWYFRRIWFWLLVRIVFVFVFISCGLVYLLLFMALNCCFVWVVSFCLLFGVLD